MWPAWLERQLDPESSAYLPGATTNSTARNWTSLGTIASPSRALVDPTGLLTPRAQGWSVDWWIGAEDRWHFPSREAVVRQGLVGTEPVVETSVRIPGGDAVARAYVVVGGAAGSDLAIIEVENRSGTPIAVAFAVRPYNGEGLSAVRAIEVRADRIVVDGRDGVLFGRAPGAAAASTLAAGDVAEWVKAARTDGPHAAVCDAGMATGAAVFALVHRSTIRVAVPLEEWRGGAMPDVVPSGADVARAWTAQTNRGLRADLPAGRLRDAFEANRRFVLESFTGDGLVTSPARPGVFEPRDAVFLLGALDRLGFHAEAADVLAGLPDRQRFDGSFGRGRSVFSRGGGQSDAAAAMIHALATHWRLSGDREVLERTLPCVGLAVRSIARSRSANGLVRTTGGPVALGPADHLYWDSWWGVRGALDAAELLRAGDEPAAAAQCDRVAEELQIAIDRQRAADPLLTAAPDRAFDVGAVGTLAAANPLRLIAADDPTVVETLRALDARFGEGAGIAASTGLSPAATLALAGVELAAGDARCLARLRWLVEVSGPTFTWPDALHPTSRTGTVGEGHSMVAAAAFATFVRRLLVDEDAAHGAGLAILRVLPEEWRGQGIEVHDAPTDFGTLSYAVRWHGERPALLWDVTGERPVRITAPALAPGWSTDERHGETLLVPA